MCARLYPWAISAAGMVLAAALGGCAGNGQARTDERANIYPENYKNELIGFLHSYINDPTQVHQAVVSQPALRLVNAAPDVNNPLDRIGRSMGRGGSSSLERYIVCVRFNAKDRDGRYTGLKQGMAIYTGGRFERFQEQRQGPCDQAKYEPFPELETLGR
jgi:hypothetical protein